MEIPKLPFRAEYAKSGRASCKKCKDPIAKDTLRMAVMVQSPFFDGMQPNWHHFECFFTRCKPKDVVDIEHFDSLRWEDQELIRKEIKNQIAGPSTALQNGKSSKGKKRSKPAENAPADLNDYTVEYAKSKRSKCKVCEEFIDKDEIRISKKDYENEIALQYGPTERWHHVDCFIKAREELEYFAAADILPGFDRLASEDQEMLKSKIPVIRRDTTDGPSPPKKSKEGEVDKRKLKKQNEKMFKFRDELEALTKPELVSLFEFNDQDVPEGVPRMLDRLSDAMTFGALERCKTCKGQLKFSSGLGYKCVGHISEWTMCQAVYPDPPRVLFKVPPELIDSYTFLKKYKGTVSKRLFLQTLSPVKVSTANGSQQRKSVFESLKFFIHKTEKKSLEEIQKQIEDLGASAVKKWKEDVFAVISTKAELERSKLSKNLAPAKESEVHVLPDNFFDDITASISKEELITKLNDRKISSWGADPSEKIKETPVKPKSVYPSKSASSSKSERFKSGETVKTVTLKDGLAVDPDSKLEKVAHVYRRGDEIFSVVLSLTDLQTKKNSYYRLQILESDKKNKYWLFRAWGRIGTTIGGNKVEQHATLNDCVDIFKDLFLEKTGNSWEMRKNFEKLPGKMMMLDVEYKDQKAEESKPKPKLESKTLSKSVQDLMTLIFDIEAMKKTMLEFELDLNKMPLGKISQKQIQKAFTILSEAQNLINSAAEHHSFVEKSNMFYTLVPHDCGVNVPPLLDNEEIIRQKIEMLNSLMDIEIAFKMLQECEKADNSIDDHYKQLKAEITDLDPDSEEFKIIQLYVKNTHAKTHMNYTLEIENVFKIERKGEAKKYEKFRKLPNRALLWHGSRVTNVAGILSQGLRIAPPEAPVTGYMFGKGVYFADMVSKSANYCNTSKKNPTGLLLLCEVALGNMHELTKAEFIKKLPAGKNSVKGVGKTEPDPSEKVITPDGVEIPLGKGVDSNVGSSSLLYNEYIVYNVAQIKIKYLLRLKFHHKI